MNFSIACTSILFLALGSTLTGCGGGSSTGPGATSSPATFDLEAASRKMLLSGHTDKVTFTLSGSVSCSGNGTFSESAATPIQFDLSPTENIPALTSTTTYSWEWSDCTPYTNTFSSADIYKASDFSYLGFIRDGEFGVYQSPEPVLNQIKAGDSGSFGSMIFFSDPTKTVSTGTATSAYRVAAGADNSSVIITFTTQSYDPENNLIETSTQTNRLSSDGTLTFISEEIISPDGYVLTIKAS